MYMNGAGTGMEIIVAVHRPILQDLHRALAAFFVAAAGATAQGAAVCRVVTTTTLTSVATSTASALSFRNYNYIP